MSFVVSARKYRPQRFEDVIGQEHITTTLRNALLTDKLAHAFLFCGPRGVGKTTCARLLAKVVNMPDPKAAIIDGSYADAEIDISLNIIELDAASNNSVDHIRTLIEQVRIPPHHGQYKVFIIDEVHMLSTAAFNAFLKTLEEPPPYAIFILATTEKHKILPTIMSRCQLYDFRRIQVEDMIGQLESIARQEGVTTEHDALYVIAEKADGAMRDALSIYDRIASASEEKISYKSVIDNLNLLDFDYFFRTVDLILREDSGGLLLLLDEVLDRGFDGDIFINGLARHVRQLLYCKQDRTRQLLQTSDALRQRYINQSEIINYSTILNLLTLSNDCDFNYPRAKDKRLHIEIALLKMCFAHRQSIPEISTTTSEKKNHKATLATPEDNPPSTSKSTDQHHQTTTIIENKTAEEAETPSIDNTTTAKSMAQVSTLEEKSEIVDTPYISDINQLLAQAEKDYNDKTTTAKPVSLDEVQQIWKEYSDNIESPSTQNVLSHIEIEVTEDRIKIFVPSTISKEEIQQEIDLFSRIRTHFNRSDLPIDVEIDRERFPDVAETTAKKVYTVKDKYDHLVKINPILDQLIDRLQLKPDE